MEKVYNKIEQLLLRDTIFILGPTYDTNSETFEKDAEKILLAKDKKAKQLICITGPEAEYNTPKYFIIQTLTFVILFLQFSMIWYITGYVQDISTMTNEAVLSFTTSLLVFYLFPAEFGQWLITQFLFIHPRPLRVLGNSTLLDPCALPILLVSINSLSVSFFNKPIHIVESALPIVTYISFVFCFHNFKYLLRIERLRSLFYSLGSRVERITGQILLIYKERLPKTRSNKSW